MSKVRAETDRGDQRVAGGLTGAQRAKDIEAKRRVGGAEAAEGGDLARGQDHCPPERRCCPGCRPATGYGGSRDGDGGNRGDLADLRHADWTTEYRNWFRAQRSGGPSVARVAFRPQAAADSSGMPELARGMRVVARCRARGASGVVLTYHVIGTPGAPVESSGPARQTREGQRVQRRHEQLQAREEWPRDIEQERPDRRLLALPSRRIVAAASARSRRQVRPCSPAQRPDPGRTRSHAAPLLGDELVKVGRRQPDASPPRDVGVGGDLAAVHPAAGRARARRA